MKNLLILGAGLRGAMLVNRDRLPADRRMTVADLDATGRPVRGRASSEQLSIKTPGDGR